MLKVEMNPEYAQQFRKCLAYWHETHPLLKEIDNQLAAGKTTIRISATDEVAMGRIETFVLNTKDKYQIDYPEGEAHWYDRYEVNHFTFQPE